MDGDGPDALDDRGYRRRSCLRRRSRPHPLRLPPGAIELLVVPNRQSAVDQARIPHIASFARASLKAPRSGRIRRRL